MNRRKFLLMTIAIIFVSLLVNNSIYYVLTKRTLERNMIGSLQEQARSIQNSFENSRTAAGYLEREISENLRSVSIAVQQQLDPDIDKVTNEQLVELSKQFQVDSITLLKDTGDDIVLYKSSDPEEIGTSTKSWKPWYQAFRQLFDEHNVTLDWGESFSHFWAGPFEYSSADPSSATLQKYGYYFDGTTNYIIDPFVNDTSYLEYQNNAGINAIIDKTVNAPGSMILDATAFNPVTFGTEEMTTVQDGEVVSHNTPRPIIYGTNLYASDRDVAKVRKAAETGKTVSTVYRSGGQHILRSYIPIEIRGSADLTDKDGTPITLYVLALSSDYHSIVNALHDQFITLVVEVSVVSVLSIVIISFIVYLVLRRRDMYIKDTQLAYIEEVNQMFTYIKGQRHDLLNHIHTVYSLISLKKYEEVKQYAKELVDDISEASDIINIGQPAISALIQSKTITAMNRKIAFLHHFDNLTNFPLDLKSVDLVRIIGNLIDNAFDAVEPFNDQRRMVEVHGYVEQGMLHIKVSNPGKLDGATKKTLFESGFTTKKGGHSGLGLAVTKQLVNKYRGSISVDTTIPGIVQFTVAISLHAKG